MSDNTEYIQSFIGKRLSSMVTGSFSFDQDELDFIESEALELYGVNSAAEATDSYKIHTLLKFKALERMLIETSDAVDHSTDGESFSNSQFSKAIEGLYKQAKKDAQPYLPSSYAISVKPMDAGFSPYLRSET